MRRGPEVRRVVLSATAPDRPWPHLVLVALLGIVGCREQKPAPKPFWSLDATDDELRRTPHRFGSFEIRPPDEFSYSGISGNGFHIWRTRTRADKSALVLQILVREVSPQEAGAPLEDHYYAALKHLAEVGATIERPALESGRINEHAFVRERSQSTVLLGEPGKQREHVVHGYAYVGVVGRQRIFIICQDVEPHYQGTLKLGERAIATLRLVPKSPP
jgi:hypothetical protein